MENDINDLPPIIYPYHIGPKTRNFSTSLLFHETLAVSLAAWPMEDPIEAFVLVGGRAEQIGHPLANIFNDIFHQFDIVQEVAVNEMKHLAPLGNKISRAITIYPGTPEHYAVWEPYHDICLPLAEKSLENVHILGAAVTDFLFRVYELMLIHEHNPDLVLSELNDRTTKLGSDYLLLAECALNRYTLPATGRGKWITDSSDMLNILSNIGKDIFIPDNKTVDFRSEGLASTLFDKILEPYTPKLDLKGIDIVNRMMSERSGELAVLRKTIVHEANTIITDSPSEKLLKSAFEASIFKVENEVSSLVNINRNGFKSLVNKLLEDRVVWATLAGFSSAATAGMPIALTAALGITALSSLGANAMKVKNESKKKIDDSPYSFIHYLNAEA
ncbi:MAG: hypothetical protein GXP22_01120 [Gammaproteobacteria bacterium]|nr:hypothetical protein [Gammaproteobacteria bacterium]